MQQEVTFYDSGIADDMQFYNGLATYRIQVVDPYNDAAAWQWIGTFYDGPGEISSETTYFDEGIVAHNSYENGALVLETAYDDPDGPNLQEWTAQITE